MIVVRLKGRLGNQMFQYAAGRALALSRGVDLALDNRVYEDRGPCALDVFNIVTVPPLRDRLPPTDKTWVMRILKSRPGTMWTRRERRTPFDPRILRLPDWSYLQGYFQDERYFTGHAKAIRAELTFRDPPDAANAAWLARIAEASFPVSVHVRRGDFADSGWQEPAAYFQDAMRPLAERGARFFIFSDDIDWCRANLAEGQFVDHNMQAPHEDLRLMAACRAHVITPRSSFSFWGKWLSGAA